MMIRRLAFLACLSAFLALPPHALADTGSGAPIAVVDAGVAPSSSDAAVAPAAIDAGVVSLGSATTPTSTATPVPEPVENPSGFIAAVKNAWSVGWGLALLVAIVGLLEAAIYAGGHIEALKKLGQGRTTVVIGGALATLTAVLGAVTSGGNWTAAIMAGVGAALAFWHLAGTDPAKS